ncbi:hypothetical protein BC567DRAFT_225095 [Phyllosticta citribraziliensis]
MLVTIDAAGARRSLLPIAFQCVFAQSSLGVVVSDIVHVEHCHGKLSGASWRYEEDGKSLGAGARNDAEEGSSWCSPSRPAGLFRGRMLSRAGSLAGIRGEWSHWSVAFAGVVLS